jgi:hypothetical protein
MPTPTYTPLANITLGSTATSVTFSSINQSYRDLIIVFTGSINTADRLGSIRFNADSGSNYSRVQMVGTGSTTSSGTLTGTATDFYYSGSANQQTDSIISIMDYSATDKHKSILSRSNVPSERTFANANRWANTAAITSIQLLPTTTAFSANGSFNIGSTFALYGIVA